MTEVWRAEPRALLPPSFSTGAPIYRVVGVCSGEVVALAADRLVTFDAGSGALRSGVPVPSSRRPSSAALSGDGSTVALGFGDGAIVGIDRARGALLWSIAQASRADDWVDGGVRAGLRVSVDALAISHDGAMAASFTTRDRTVQLWHRGAWVGWLPERAPLAFSPDGALLWAGTSLYDVLSGRRLARHSPRRGVTAAAFSGDGGKLALGSDDGTIDLFDVRPWSPLASSPAPPDPVLGLAFSQDGRRLLAWSIASYRAVDSARCAPLYDGWFDAHHLAMDTAAVRLIGVAPGEDRLVALDPEAGAEGLVQHGSSPIAWVSLSGSDPVVAAGTADGTIRAWDAAGAPMSERRAQGGFGAVPASEPPRRWGSTVTLPRARLVLEMVQRWGDAPPGHAFRRRKVGGGFTVRGEGPLESHRPEGSCRVLDVTEDQRRVAIAEHDASGDRLLIYDTARRRVVAVVSTDGAPTAAALHRDGSEVVIGTDRGGVYAARLEGSRG